MMPRPTVQVCRDFVNGVCKRGDTCRFSHSERDRPICGDNLTGKCTRGDKCKFRHIDPREEERKRHTRDLLDDGDRDLKRRRYDDDYSSSRGGGLSYTMLEDENALLKRKVEELKKQVICFSFLFYFCISFIHSFISIQQCLGSRPSTR